MGSDMRQYLASGNTGLHVLSLSRVTSKRKIVAESEIRLTLNFEANRYPDNKFMGGAVHTRV
jgi:hypothetical protein